MALAEVLQYRNLRVIDSFSHKNPNFSRPKVKQLFSDLLAWMWLSQQRKAQGKKTYLFGPLLALDEIWHEFILHTQDYIAFCNAHFGEYFHHEVEPVGMEHQVTEEEIVEFLEDCFIYLDAEWVARCFEEALVLG